MQRPTTALALPERILVGGEPHGIAFSEDKGQSWQAAWTSQIQSPALIFAADSDYINSGVILAGTEGGGVLRSTDRGRSWTPVNYGLKQYTVMAIGWAPPTPGNHWPPRSFVFMATEEGVYHSPNGGRAWKRSRCPEAAYQCLAVSPNFFQNGTVLAGSEDAGLFRSTDGGVTFEPVAGAPQQVNSLLAVADGWLLSDWEGIHTSPDGLSWQPLAQSVPALVLAQAGDALLAGTEEGVFEIGDWMIG
jgi:photosystem II stability/assembly factor-like uncharacterized protein